MRYRSNMLLRTAGQLPIAAELAAGRSIEMAVARLVGIPIGVAIRYSESGDKWSTEARYYLNSRPMNVQRFARFVRGHWAIESTLHWCLDVTFRDDESRVRDRNTATNLAWLNRFGLSLLMQQDDKHSIAMRRRIAGWNLNYLAQVLGIPTL